MLQIKLLSLWKNSTAVQFVILFLVDNGINYDKILCT